MADVNGKPNEEDVSSFIFHEYTKDSKSTFLHKNFSVGNDYHIADIIILKRSFGPHFLNC